MRRRATLHMLVAGLSGLAIAGLTERWGVPAQAASLADRNRERAIASYNAMQKYFYKNDGSSLYLDQYPVEAQDRPYAFEWPFSQAHIATIDLSNLPGSAGDPYRSALADRSRGQEHYWNTTGPTGNAGYDSYPRSPYGNGDDRFYDDNGWVGLAKTQLYNMLGDQAALKRAEEIFALVISGWDTDPSHPAPGGVFWTQAAWCRDRNTVSNMPGAQLGLRLYQATGKPDYLSWSRKMYEWTNQHLLAPNGLFWDHIDLQGNIEKTQWSYNQGVPIGVNTLFYQITKDVTYLWRAENIAQAALTFYGAEDRLIKQPAHFNSIFFKNLLLLQSVNHNQRYIQAMQAYADRVWESQRDTATGIFRFGARTLLLEQAAMIQIYAVLGWSPSDYGKLY